MIYFCTRPKTVFEVMSDMWNSSDFNPIAHASDCHTDYIDAIDCSHTTVELLSPATPQKIEDILVSMRSDLLRIITRWEQSGQGEGGRDQDENSHEEGSEHDDIESDVDGEGRESIHVGGVGGGGLLSGRPAQCIAKLCIISQWKTIVPLVFLGVS
jgi:hypothetical protein